MIGSMYGSVHAQLRFNGWHLKEHMHLGRSCKRELLKVHVFEDSWIIFMGENYMGRFMHDSCIFKMTIQVF